MAEATGDLNVLLYVAATSPSAHQELMKTIAGSAVPAQPPPGASPDSTTLCFYINV